jgi:SAM-dependent methyltransferase
MRPCGVRGVISPRRQTHIEYYRQHAIAPVRYDLSDMPAHLQRREALYNRLALPALAFRGSRVLEVAAGTGHNSLYLAWLLPARLVLLEPNATARECLRRAYAGFDPPHTVPEVVPCTLEEFDPAEPFDIVLCENWLGTSAHDLAMLDRLAGMVAPAGVLVLTAVSPIGIVPNLLRRFLVPRLVGAEPDFEARSRRVAAAFAPHLSTLDGMTRSVTDWVQDNMLNPAYFGVCLSIPAVLERLGARFAVLGSSPAFAEDWRWFKAMAGRGRLDDHVLGEYWRKAHNYLDHREPASPGDAEANRRLERAALDLLEAVEAHEDACARGDDPSAWAARVRERLERFIGRVPPRMSEPVAALREFAQRGFDPPPASPAVAGMARFGALFGRETSYLSLVRRPAGASGTRP